MTAADDLRTVPPGWTLAWEDQFDHFDESRWTKVDTNVPTNESLQDYLPQQVQVDGGKLIITSTNEPSRGLPYRSGQVISSSEQLHGRFEVRARLPGTVGTWPAIWLLPDVEKVPWPSGGEIDIMENRGDQPTLTSSAFHYGASTPYRHEIEFDQQQTAVLGSLANYHREFHTFAVDWTAKRLRFYIDDVNFYTIYDEHVEGFLSQQVKPMQIVINTAVGGAFLPNPDPTSEWPQRLEVDWVRVYKAEGKPPRHAFRNGGFEEGGGSLAGWSVFGDGLRDDLNVRVATRPVVDGTASLRLSGSFNASDRYSGVAQGITAKPGQAIRAALRSCVRAEETIAGGDNAVSLKIEFYREFGARYGSDAMLAVEEIPIANGDTAEDSWVEQELIAVAPPRTTEARVAIVFHQRSQATGAVYVDNVDFGESDHGPAASQRTNERRANAR